MTQRDEPYSRRALASKYDVRPGMVFELTERRMLENSDAIKTTSKNSPTNLQIPHIVYLWILTVAKPRLGTKPKKRKVNICTFCVPEVKDLRDKYLPPTRTTVQFTYVTQMLKVGATKLGTVEWRRQSKYSCTQKFYKLIGVL